MKLYYQLLHIKENSLYVYVTVNMKIATPLSFFLQRFKKQSKAAAAAGHQGVAQHMQVDIGGLMDIDTSGLLDPSRYGTI